ncbi:MAG: YgaP family membrane protein [Gemmatimonadaceae bacterium]
MSVSESFGQSWFARFINSVPGRVARIVVGLILIGWGYTLRGTEAGTVLVVIGFIPLLAGLFDRCLISALLGGPFSGARLRKPKP